MVDQQEVDGQSEVNPINSDGAVKSHFSTTLLKMSHLVAENLGH